MILVGLLMPQSLGHGCQLQHQVLLSNPFSFFLLPSDLTSGCLLYARHWACAFLHYLLLHKGPAFPFYGREAQEKGLDGQ